MFCAMSMGALTAIMQRTGAVGSAQAGMDGCSQMLPEP